MLKSKDTVKNNVIHSALKGTEGLILRDLFQKQNFITLITTDNSYIDSVADTVAFFNPDIEVLKLPAWDCLPYDRISPNNDIVQTRLNTFAKLATSPKKNTILIASINSATQKLPPKQTIMESCLAVRASESISQKKILQYLIANGYRRSATANDPGEFAVRGSIIDVVTLDSSQGYRIDFFGDNIDSIRTFDIDTQISTGKISTLCLTPVSEIILNQDSIELFKEQYRQNFGFTNDPLFESVSAGKKYAGQEHWLPLFYNKLDTIFDYIPENSLVLCELLFDEAIVERSNYIEEQYDLRVKTSKKSESNYYPLKPEELYLSSKEFGSKLENHELFTLSHYNSQNVSDNYQHSPNLHVESITQKKPALEILKELLAKSQKQQVLISCFTGGSLKRIENLLQDNDIVTTTLDSWHKLSKVKKGVIGLFVSPIETGFSFEEKIIFSEQDILGRRLSRKAVKKKGSKKFLQEISSLKPGELIVHSEHGIGKFEGLETVKVSNSIHDFIKLTYADNDKFYLPVENLELISKYGSDDSGAKLDKLGATSWQLRKAKLKERIKIAAKKLLQTAAAREVQNTESLVAIEDMYEEFCKRFPYMETDDQLRAIEEVINDLSSDKSMDRLVCGDVGFGKTEVALRAAFIAVASNKPVQVAIVVPTTLLARQHYKTFSERFAGLPINIKQLSRFVTSTEAKKVKKGISDGTVDIVIGTHTLLAKDINFKNLGLIIIDEEQHFGVGQKERLKELKTGVHILTLSATPIPRTLQMSLSGVKELSLIATPPVDREPIRTHVMPYDPLIIREAILREHHRGGRTFYVTPRTSYLDSITETLNEIVPEIRTVTAHGKIPANKLDSIMNDFYDGKFDVLISTSIVESGLDIPMANTMIIDRADMFGLAQLYQIRGRVGRSNTKAYAYVTVPPKKRLSSTAEQRLDVLGSMDTLGAGFSIASHDMDIRGYGNLVGEEQSGHIKEVGIELYQHMLTEAIEDLKKDGEKHIDKDWSPSINIGISVQIPESYIPDIALRLNLYRQVASLDSEEALEELATEMIDRFGPLPEETEHLISIVKLKQLAKLANIEKIDCGEKGVVITFKDKKPNNPQAVVNFVANNSSDAKLRGDQKLLILRTWQSTENQLKGIEKILEAISI